MGKYYTTLSDMHRVEANHLRDKLRIAMQALEALAQDGNEIAQRALQRIEGDE